jgi:hypothetical protein
VAKVSELKERARTLEQQGEAAKARAIYEHILKHLEGTPALLPELPMYVKVGDLSLKLGDPAAAVTMYEKAAGHYAVAGSARSIGALAEKIRRADPTRDDAAVGLGRGLLEHGHAGAAAEVLLRYARRVERVDVVALLTGVAPTAADPAALGLVESAVAMLAGPRLAEAEPEARPSEPVPSVRPPGVSPPEPAPPQEELQEPEDEPEEGPKLDLPLISFGPDSRVGERAAPPAGTDDDDLVIRHGVEEPSVAEAPAPVPAPRSEPEILPHEMEEAEEPPTTMAAESPEEPLAKPELEPPPVEPAYERPAEAEPVPVAHRAEPRAAPRPAERSLKGRGWPEDPHVLVRRPRSEKGGRGGLIAAGVGLVVVVGGAAAWAFGLLPFGRGDDDGGGVPEPAGAAAVVESLPAPPDSAAGVAVGDTTSFGPIGFNTVTNAGVDPRSGDTIADLPGGTDTATFDVPAPPPARPAIVVPPGHAIIDEIVVVPGLEVVSVAETRVAGALGIRVIQRAEDGEITLVATVGDFGGDTAGSGQVAVRTEDSLSIGEVRVGRYLVEGRSTLPADVLSGFLGRLIRARPVN